MTNNIKFFSDIYVWITIIIYTIVLIVFFNYIFRLICKIRRRKKEYRKLFNQEN